MSLSYLNQIVFKMIKWCLTLSKLKRKNQFLDTSFKLSNFDSRELQSSQFKTASASTTNETNCLSRAKWWRTLHKTGSQRGSTIYRAEHLHRTTYNEPTVGDRPSMLHPRPPIYRTKRNADVPNNQFTKMNAIKMNQSRRN